MKFFVHFFRKAKITSILECTKVLEWIRICLTEFKNVKQGCTLLLIKFLNEMVQYGFL